MLANTYNIGIKNATDEILIMDQVEMTLLSTTRHHENMFQDSNTGEHKTASPKRKGRQRKTLAANASFASDDDTNSSSPQLYEKSVIISSKKDKGRKSKGTKRKKHLEVPPADNVILYHFTAISGIVKVCGDSK